MKHRLLVVGFAFLLLFSAATPLLRPSVASAAQSGKWIDAAHISLGGNNYVDGTLEFNSTGLDQSKRKFYLNNNPGCVDFIDSFNGIFSQGTLTHQNKQTLSSRTGSTTSCVVTSQESVSLSDTQNNFLTFVFKDSTEIDRVDGKEVLNGTNGVGDFTQAGNSCGDVIAIPTAYTSTSNKEFFASLTKHHSVGTRNQTSCQQNGDPISVFIGRFDKSANAPKPTSGSSSSSSTTPQNSCDSQGGLSWIICPVISLLDSATSSLDTVIKSQLETKDPTTSDARLKQTWGRIRNVALIILVPIMLVMVIGTALGIGGLDAYTVKRAMPRLLIAVLLISVSWYLMAFLINLNNVVGRGVLGLISQPFGVVDKSLKDFISVGSGSAISYGGLAVFGGLILAGKLSLPIIFSFALVAAVALFAGFIVLVIRQILIVALMLIAPLAILAWIFPSNDKGWKLWWGTFSKLLLMYPLIMLLIGAGRIFASVVPIQQGSDNPFTEILVLLAYILPYFFIPFTFKFAGGILGNLAGFVNDRGRGFFDKQREYRAKQREELSKEAGANRRFNPAGKLRRLNTLAGWTASPVSNLAYKYRTVPGLSGRGQKIKSQIEADTVDQTGKLMQELNNVFGYNDKAYRALTGAHDELKGKDRVTGVSTIDKLKTAGLYGRAPRTVDEFNQFADILASSDSATENLAANALRTSAGRITSLYRDPEMLKASAQAAGLMGLSSHGFAGSGDITEVGNKLISQQHLSPELAQTLVSRAQVVGQGQRPDIKAGYGTVFRDGEFVDGMTDVGGRAWDLLGTIGQGDIVQSKSGFLKTSGGIIKELIRAGGNPEAARSAWEQAGLSEAEITKRLEIARRQAKPLQDELFQAASRYSGAPVETKALALESIDELGLRDIFDRTEQLRLLQTEEGGGNPPPEPNPTGQ